MSSLETFLSARLPCLLFNRVVFWGALSCVYVVDIKPLSDVSLANVFSHPVGCLFLVPMGSFPVQNLLSLMWSCRLLFLLFPLLEETHPKR